MTAAGRLSDWIIVREDSGQDLYILPVDQGRVSTMASRPYRALVAAAYQLCLAVGILAMPVALAAGKLGLRVPIDRLVRRLRDAYETADQ